MTKKFLGIAFLAMALCVGFASCSDDDEVKTDRLVGKWYVTHVEGWYMEDGDKKDYSWGVNDVWTYQFNSDNSGTEVERGGDSYSFTWSVPNDTHIRMAFSGKTDETVEVSKLTKSTFIYKYETSDEYRRVTMEKR
ncbi:MAG: lipocalin family protein [Bacteroides sp.]|nr:lipocalin family protein [Bacteroides sp.]